MSKNNDLIYVGMIALSNLLVMGLMRNRLIRKKCNDGYLITIHIDEYVLRCQINNTRGHHGFSFTYYLEFYGDCPFDAEIYSTIHDSITRALLSYNKESKIRDVFNLLKRQFDETKYDIEFKVAKD